MIKLKKHLAESDMTYSQHLSHSVKQSNKLIIIAIKSYLHGIFPWLFANAGPLGVYHIYKEIRHKHHIQKMFHKADNES